MDIKRRTNVVQIFPNNPDHSRVVMSRCWRYVAARWRY